MLRAVLLPLEVNLANCYPQPEAPDSYHLVIPVPKSKAMEKVAAIPTEVEFHWILNWEDFPLAGGAMINHSVERRLQGRVKRWRCCLLGQAAGYYY